MPVFRVEKTHNYTIMANHHLQDKTISLKAKGLLSVMLSLPDNWDYTLSGLSCISKEGIDAIREGVRELEKAGYINRERVRDAHGRLRNSVYVIYEEPRLQNVSQPEGETPAAKESTLEVPTLDSATMKHPMWEQPTLEKPMQEKAMQLNTHISTPKSSIKKQKIIDPATPNPSNPYQPMPNATCSYDHGDILSYLLTRDKVRKQISYDCLAEDLDRERLDEMVELITEALCSTKPTMKITGQTMPIEMVRERLRQINSSHIEYVFECLKRSAPNIRNIKQYLLTALYNAPATISSYYSARVEREHSLI